MAQPIINKMLPLSQLLARSAVRLRATSSSVIPASIRPSGLSRALSTSRASLSGGHDDHHDDTLEPPYHRLPMNRPLHEQDELIWNDGVAPETAIDFDAPQLETSTVLLMWLGGFAFFALVWQAAVWYDPASRNPAAPREIPPEVDIALGGYQGRYQVLRNNRWKEDLLKAPAVVAEEAEDSAA